MTIEKITEQSGEHQDLESKSSLELIEIINGEDHKVAQAVQKVLPQISQFVDLVVQKLETGGRLFYFGSGTSGRLGILDASECPPTYGVSPDLVIGLIAGGDTAIRVAVEQAEDDLNQAWLDLKTYQITDKDIVLGISASGTTPYVIGGLKACKQHGIICGALSCNPNSMIGQIADYKVEVVVGPEVVRGSTRMKAGTAQKMVLNLISTATMIALGHVHNNQMVDMKLSNNKLVERAVSMVKELGGVEEAEARSMLNKFGSVRAVLNQLNQ
jgi:N-acetylmuramic acid 6-phosphate etherase